MADIYSSYQQLAAAEHEGHDFRVRSEHRQARYAIVAPHGGNIEPGTSEVAHALASHDLSLYLFEGLKYYGNGSLHITSARFDEPRCLAVIDTAHTAITVHGEGSESQHVFVGGLDVRLVELLGQALTMGNFSVAVHTSPKMQGVHPLNICNRARSGKGVQLEMARGLRETFFESMSEDGRARPTRRMAEFVGAVRGVLDLAGN